MPSLLRRIYPIMFTTLVVLIAVTLLVFTESFTSPIVEKRLRQQVIDQMGDIFTEIGNYDYDEENELYTLYNGTETIGYAFLAIGSGYAGNISILVGLEDSETVKGIIILSHTETPGIGDRIENSEFLNQFIGLNINDVSLKRDGGQVDALTAATISSRAVVDAVRKTAIEKVQQIEGVN